VAVGGGRLVDRPAEIEVLDHPLRVEREDLADRLDDV